MQFGAGVSILDDAVDAVDEALRRAVEGFTNAPDLVFGFVSSSHLQSVGEIATQLSMATSVKGVSLGAVSDGIVAGSEEFESGPVISVWAAWLGSAQAHALRMKAHRTEQGIGIAGLHPPDDAVGLVMLADAFSFPVGGVVESLDPLPVVGGLPASPEPATLFLDGHVLSDGAVAVALSGDVVFASVVSQGCEPIGKPVIVTRSAGRVIEEIAGVPAVTFVNSLVSDLDESRQELVANGLHLGLVIDEYAVDPGRGDFLIRSVMAADREAGSIVVGDQVEVGSTVQFQLRDPRTAADDLRQTVSSLGHGGMLLFTCNARGQAFFGSPNHDAGLVAEVCRPAALAGMVSAGEIGPIGGKSFVHGYSAAIVEIGQPDHV